MNKTMIRALAGIALATVACIGCVSMKGNDNTRVVCDPNSDPCEPFRGEVTTGTFYGVHGGEVEHFVFKYIDDAGVERAFDGYLWAPEDECGCIWVPGDEVPVTADLIPDLHSGFVLLRGLTGTLPRSKSGGGVAAGQGTTIVVWASQPGEDPEYRALCLAGDSCRVAGLMGQGWGSNTYQLSDQICDPDYFFEWYEGALTETIYSQAIKRKRSSNQTFSDEVDDLVDATGVTPN